MQLQALALLASLWLAPTPADPSATPRHAEVAAPRWMEADDDGQDWGRRGDDDDDGGRDWDRCNDDDNDDGGWGDGGGGDGGSHGAPEIDPGLLVAGLVLLAGGTAILVGQRRLRTSGEAAS